MRVNYFIDRFRTEITQHGLWELTQKCWSKFANYLYHSTRSIWYARNLEDPINHFTLDIILNIEFLDHDKYRLVEWLRENKSKYPWIYFEKEVEAALRHNHVFLIMLHQDQIIGYVKIGIGPTYINDFSQMIAFMPGTAFVYDTFTLPDYRGRGLALFALIHAFEYFKARNFKRIFCHIEKWNVPSIKTFEKAGFRVIDTIKFVRSPGFSFFIRRGYIPFLNLEKHLLSYK